MTKREYGAKLDALVLQIDAVDPLENLIAMSKLQQEYIESLEEHNAVQKDIIQQYQVKEKGQRKPQNSRLCDG